MQTLHAIATILTLASLVPLASADGMPAAIVPNDPGAASPSSRSPERRKGCSDRKDW